MGWADGFVKQLTEGKTVSFRPHGNSMAPIIRSGQKVTVESAQLETIREGDIVLCAIGRSQYVHLVKAVDTAQGRVQIGNNRGHINGWTSRVHGKVVKVED